MLGPESEKIGEVASPTAPLQKGGDLKGYRSPSVMAGIFLFLRLVWGALYAPLAHTSDAGGLFAAQTPQIRPLGAPMGILPIRLAFFCSLYLSNYRIISNCSIWLLHWGRARRMTRRFGTYEFQIQAFGFRRRHVTFTNTRSSQSLH